MAVRYLLTKIQYIKYITIYKIHYILIDSFLFLFLQLHYLYTFEAEEAVEHVNNTNNNPAIDVINSLFV